MIILFRPSSTTPPPSSLAATALAALGFGARSATQRTTYQPIVILDYTRSDEQWSTTQIKSYVKQLGTPLGGTLTDHVTYSLDYTMSYTHKGISYGDSLKTHFTATIRNAPIQLVNLLNIQQYTSAQNIDALKTALNAVIDPQIQFPQGGFVIKSAPDSKGKSDIVTRSFIIYSSPSDYDAKTRNSTLYLNGAAFDAMVMRLKFAVNIDKTKTLYSQLNTLLSGFGFSTFASAAGLKDRLPVVAKYYAPAPIYDILTEVCLDNKITFYQLSDIFVFIDLSPDSPPDQDVKAKYSFANSVQGTKLLMTFKPDNYVNATMEGEIYDAKLFTSISVYDDSYSKGKDSSGNDSPGIFSTYTKIPGSYKFSPYRFYITSYTYIDSREKTSITITGTNNWLISLMRIDSLLENAIYKNQL